MSEDEPDLDPRIQEKLETLNTTTEEINKLEIQYDEANTTFRMLLNENTRRLTLFSNKLGSCIEKARPYYEMLEVAKKAQQECQNAALLYQKASGIHEAAKETVALAEQRFLTNKHEWKFDNAWQEMLNHAIMKVMEAENQKTLSDKEHHLKAAEFKKIEEKIRQMEDNLQKSIIKSRPYFEEKILCKEQLDTQKERVESIKQDILRAKNKYADTLRELEAISNEIHYKREHESQQKKEELMLKEVREPGVGAELKETFQEVYDPSRSGNVSTDEENKVSDSKIS